MNGLICMSRWWIGLTLLCFALVVPAKETLTLAYLKEGLQELDKSEKLIAIQIWAEAFAQQNQVAVEVRPVNSINELTPDLQAQQIDFALFNTGQYLKQYAALKPFLAPEIYAVQRTENLYEDYVLLSKNASAIRTLADLKGKRLSLTTDHTLYLQYLEYLTRQTANQKVAQFFKQIRNAPTASQSVLDVFFGNSDACLVPRHIYQMTAALNPAILQELNIVHSSGPVFIPAVLVAFNTEALAMRRNFGQYLTESHQTIRGQQIFDLFKIERIVQIDAAQLQPLFAFYE